MSENAENLPEIPVLTSAEKSGMRSLLQTLTPVIIIGKNGVTQSVIKEIEAAFKAEDLIKVKFTGDRKEVAGQIETISRAARAAIVGGVGKVAGFYRHGTGAEPAEVAEEVEEDFEPKKKPKRKA